MMAQVVYEPTEAVLGELAQGPCPSLRGEWS